MNENESAIGTNKKRLAGACAILSVIAGFAATVSMGEITEAIVFYEIVLGGAAMVIYVNMLIWWHGCEFYASTTHINGISKGRLEMALEAGLLPSIASSAGLVIGIGAAIWSLVSASGNWLFYAAVFGWWVVSLVLATIVLGIIYLVSHVISVNKIILSVLISGFGSIQSKRTVSQEVKQWMKKIKSW